MIADPHRGFLLEVLLSKAMFVLDNKVQIIGMSATLPNVNDLATWIRGSLYCTAFRPVALDLLVCCENRLLRAKTVSDQCPGSYPVEAYHVVFESVRMVRKLQLPRAIDAEGFISLALETLQSGRSVLLFCPSKERCERCCDLLAEALNGDTIVRSDHDRVQLGRSGVLNELQQTPVGICPRLLKAVPHGVAYHHAGLIADERKIIENVIYRMTYAARMIDRFSCRHFATVTLVYCAQRPPYQRGSTYLPIE